MLKYGSKSLNASRNIWTLSFVEYYITSTRSPSISRRLNICSTIFWGYEIAFAYAYWPNVRLFKSWMCSARTFTNGTRVSFFNNIPDKTSTDCTSYSSSSPSSSTSIVSSVSSSFYYISSSSGSTPIASLLFAKFSDLGRE